jgi:nitrate/nitrite-specific signal transduction histidine kinase
VPRSLTALSGLNLTLRISSDRLAVIEGQLRVESPAEGGTLVAADIPTVSSGSS